ncbi:MAG: DNA polymerase III subunit gamma/tau [Proteobacteria bacterium]|nr:DNA polymerase III subunit gamma/tau [Pseudomonadota bacterium]
MSSYIVLARKYRPQTFADLVGQEHISSTLQNAIRQNRIAHAYLFTGSRGIGKTTSARIFAKALNCENAPFDAETKKFTYQEHDAIDPCNHCATCEGVTHGNAIDVVEMDAASNTGVDDVRESIIDVVNYKPAQSRYKIYIIDEVHMLSNSAWNALLKTLEEPPAHVVFIFATTDPNKIPVTVLSRCQRYDFKRIKLDALVAHLRRIADAEGILFEEDALKLIARHARGGVRDALSAMDQVIAFAEQPITAERTAEVLGVASRETLMSFVESVLKRDVAHALECVYKVDHYGQDLARFSFDVLEVLRDMTVMVADPGTTNAIELDAQEQQRLRACLNGIPLECLQRIFGIWYQTADQLKNSLSPRLLMEMSAVRMCQVEPVVPLDAILNKLDFLSQMLGSGNVVPADALEKARAFLASQPASVQKLTSDLASKK